MQFPKLTPLQSRLVACIVTLSLLLILYLSLSPNHFAYAAELDSSVLDRDHNHHRIPEWPSNDIDWGEEEKQDLGVAQYQAEFAGFSRSIIGRADSALTELKDNIPLSMNVVSGQTQYFVFLNSSVSAPFSTAGNGLPPEFSNSSMMAGLQNNQPSESTRNVFISVNTCTQPNSTSSSSSNPPQLTLYVSTTDFNQNPGPGAPDNQQMTMPLSQGYGQLGVPANGNVYVGVSGPPNSTTSISQWNFQIAASIEDYALYATNTNFTFLLDTDSDSALISTFNLTDSNDTNVLQQWQNLGSSGPFKLFVFNASSTPLNGIQNSYCGISKLSSQFNASSSITTRNGGHVPKQQFLVEGLQSGQDYVAYLGYQAPNETADVGFVGGAGQIWSQLSFRTKSGMSCPNNYLTVFNICRWKL
jgi:calcium channel MID1